MRSLAALLGITLLAMGCQRSAVKKPVWLNPAAVVAVPGALLHFNGSAADWQACLYSFTQPIQLNVRSGASGFTVSLAGVGGVLEGPAQLCLTAGEQSFYFPVELRNSKSAAITPRDYRSPKTVNPDSSLQQQRITHAVDSYRNLIPSEKDAGFFGEQEVNLSPRSATYRAIPNESLTAYYVQPGSCTDIPIEARYRRDVDSYQVTVGPLVDRYQNQVADGTLVNFMYEGSGETYRMEATVLNGFSTVMIPAEHRSRYRLKAAIQNAVSKTITLQP